jgi:crotonobetainyl-CoA:carnitine CoA-transferase CaiB-like acyl-CoA transferase
VEVSAAALSLLGFAFQQVEGAATPQYADRENITDFYATRDGRWFLVHGGFDHLQQGALELLGIETRDPAPKHAVAAAIAGWNALALEEAIALRGLCGAMVRSEAEWRAHLQGRALAPLGVVEVIRVGDSDPEPFAPEGDRPLSGVRVLDLTRVLAGPTCARTLAEHGAEVLKINSPDLPSVPLFVMDTGHGKRSAYLDLRDPSGADRLRELVARADVFSQGYREGAMRRLGFDVEALHALRPGLVYTSINCYGHAGPWSERRGWEQLAQTVTGIAQENGREAVRPVLLPAAATDYTTGYLAALGTLAALLRRAEEGGSYHVRVSLAQTGMWIQGMGRCAEIGSGPSAELVTPRITASETPHGKLRHLAPAVEMSRTPARWELPTVPLGTHAPSWALLRA